MLNKITTMNQQKTIRFEPNNSNIEVLFLDTLKTHWSKQSYLHANFNRVKNFKKSYCTVNSWISKPHVPH